MSSLHIIPSSLWHSPGFQQLQTFSKDSTAQHSTGENRELSSYFTFCLFSTPVSTLRRVTMRRQTVPSKPAKCCAMKTRQSLRGCRGHRREVLTAIARKGPQTCLYLDHSKCCHLNQPLILFSKTNCCLFHT